MKIRFRFSKTGALRFIGHLDFLRVFGQTVRRTGLPAAFSQGFNPHLQISFALPLSLGMQSENDYADLTLTEECPNIPEKLNAAAPAGLIIKDAYPAVDKAASVVCVADYKFSGRCPEPRKGTSPLDPRHLQGDVGEILRGGEIFVAKKTKNEGELGVPFYMLPSASPLDPLHLAGEVGEILRRGEIFVAKKTKKGVREVDIRPDILELEAREDGVFMRLSAGSARFLNPLTVAGLLLPGGGEKPMAANITRLELYREDGTTL